MAKVKLPQGYDKLSKRDKLRVRSLGNVSSATNPMRTYMRRRILLNPADAVAVRLAERLKAGLLSDKGGEGNVTEAERGLIDGVGLARVISLICLREISEHGAFKDGADGRVASPAVKLLSSFLSLERQGIQTLGLERRASKADNIHDYLRVIDTTSKLLEEGKTEQ